MTSLLLAARLLLLVAVFVVSAVAKLADRAGSRSAVASFGVPAALVGGVTAVVPVLEIAAAGLLLTAGPGVSAGAALVVALLGVFTAPVLLVLAHGPEVTCHCFGALSSGPVGPATVVRNAALLALAGLVLAGGVAQPPAPALLGSTPGVQMAVGMVLAALVVVAVLLSALRRARAVGAWAGPRLTHAERSAATGGAPPPADLALPDLDGVPTRLSTLVSDGRPALLLLVGAHCPLSDTLLPELERWEASTDGPAHVVVVSSGDPHEVRAKVRGVLGLGGRAARWPRPTTWLVCPRWCW